MAKILLVDDSPLLLRIEKSLLEQAHHTVVTAKNGREALVLAEKATPQVIFMDAEMPEMDGPTACRALKQNPATKAIPVYICTGQDADGDRKQEFGQSGADGFVPKPFHIEDLLPLIAKATGTPAP